MNIRAFTLIQKAAKALIAADKLLPSDDPLKGFMSDAHYATLTLSCATHDWWMDWHETPEAAAHSQKRGEANFRRSLVRRFGKRSGNKMYRDIMARKEKDDGKEKD